jgi:cytochrome P450
MMLPAFHGERMRRYEQIMDQAALREIDAWRAGDELRLLPAMQSVTLEVIMRAIFGVEEGLELDRLRSRLQRLLRQTTSTGRLLLRALLGPDSERLNESFRAAIDPVDEELHRVIAERRRASDIEQREDILSLLLRARDADGEGLGDDELRDELMTLLLAGHETTATTLAWAFERITRHPDVLARVTEEALTDGDAPYTEAVIQETLRLRPVLPLVARIVTRPITVGQGRFRLPAGTRVAPASILVHYREDIYPEPLEFRPERFLDEPPGTYTWIPFGGGMRRCLGAAFAQFEAKTVIRAVLSSVELEPVGRGERTGRRGFTLVPRDGARVRVVRRLPSAAREDRELAAA